MIRNKGQVVTFDHSDEEIEVRYRDEIPLLISLAKTVVGGFEICLQPGQVFEVRWDRTTNRHQILVRNG